MPVPTHLIDAIVVGLHLRWAGVWQRPNHILARLAEDVPVIVLEEPVRASTNVESITTNDGITIVTPHRTSRLDEAADAAACSVVKSLVGERRPLIWLYTPMMIELANTFADAPLVFDKMDELSAFVGADPLLGALENETLRRANFVFAGGRSLHRSVRERAERTRCYPSGVDVDHFARATREAAHPKLAPFADRPIFGYVGVIDERIDLELIAAIADARPDGVVVMVGPVVKIAPESLPRRANIVYLGKAEYHELPAFLAGFDVAIMPFALNRHTANISPTKTLEYLAAGKPVVSTAVPDVVADFGDVVRIALSPKAFVDALDAAQRPDRERENHARAKVRSGSWDAIVHAMTADLATCGIDIAVPRQPATRPAPPRIEPIRGRYAGQPERNAASDSRRPASGP